MTLINRNSVLHRNSALFFFTLPIPLAIMGIGLNFILNPIGASAGYGIPMSSPQVFPYMWIKGIRDIFSGLVILFAISTRDRYIVASLFCISTLIAVGDGFVILAHLGWALPLITHWGTATYMAVVGWNLFHE